MPKSDKGYDETLDTVLAEVGTIDINDKAEFQVTVRAYDGGEPRACIIKRGKEPNRKGNIWVSSNPGRLSGGHAMALGELLAQAGGFILELEKASQEQAMPKAASKPKKSKKREAKAG